MSKWLTLIKGRQMDLCSFCRNNVIKFIRHSPVMHMPDRKVCKKCAIRDLGKKLVLETETNGK